MRIIGGTLRGLRINPPKNLPVRPTTDLAKEALFNILQNELEFEGLKVLDLFCGTGNISLEFASRGASEVVAVDRSIHCLRFVADTAKQHHLGQIKVNREDVMKYLHHESETFDVIFADPPYDLNRIPEIPLLVFEKKLLKPAGLLVIEHQSMQNLGNHPAFTEQRRYGYSSFSFFRASL